MKSLSFTARNDVTLLHCGAEFFPALVEAIDGATAEIYLETYIFADDPTANQVRDALLNAAKRGVIVRIIADWVGTGRQQCMALKQAFTAGRVHFRIFNPWFER